MDSRPRPVGLGLRLLLDESRRTRALGVGAYLDAGLDCPGGRVDGFDANPGEEVLALSRPAERLFPVLHVGQGRGPVCDLVAHGLLNGIDHDNGHPPVHCPLSAGPAQRPAVWPDADLYRRLAQQQQLVVGRNTATVNVVLQGDNVPRVGEVIERHCGFVRDAPRRAAGVGIGRLHPPANAQHAAGGKAQTNIESSHEMSPVQAESL